MTTFLSDIFFSSALQAMVFGLAAAGWAFNFVKLAVKPEKTLEAGEGVGREAHASLYWAGLAFYALAALSFVALFWRVLSS